MLYDCKSILQIFQCLASKYYDIFYTVKKFLHISASFPQTGMQMIRVFTHNVS